MRIRRRKSPSSPHPSQQLTTKRTVAMSAACHNENKRPRPSSSLTSLDGNVLGNENDKLIVDTTELQTKYNMLKGFNTELGKRYDKLKDLYTELRNKYDRLRERLQTEEVRFFRLHLLLSMPVNPHTSYFVKCCIGFS